MYLRSLMPMRSGNLRRIVGAAIPTREESGRGRRTKQRPELSWLHRLERLVDVVFDPWRCPGSPHRHRPCVAGELDCRCAPLAHTESPERCLYFVERRAAQEGAVGHQPRVTRRTVRQPDRDALRCWNPPQVGQCAVGARLHGGLCESRGSAGKRDDLRIEDAKRSNIEFIEHALPGANPVGVAVQRGRLDERLGTDRLQHLPISGGLATRIVDGIRPQIVDRRLVVFLR